MATHLRSAKPRLSCRRARKVRKFSSVLESLGDCCCRSAPNRRDIMTTTEPTTPTNSRAEPYENYNDKREKTIRDLKQALSAIFVVSFFGALQQTEQQYHYVSGAKITPGMIGYMAGMTLLWGIGELWVLSRKSRLGAVVLFIIAMIVFLSTIEMTIEQNLGLNTGAAGLAVLISIYIIAMTFKLRRLEIAEKAYWASLNARRDQR